jgi:hypothetical protein
MTTPIRVARFTMGTALYPAHGWRGRNGDTGPRHDQATDEASASPTQERLPVHVDFEGCHCD